MIDMHLNALSCLRTISLWGACALSVQPAYANEKSKIPFSVRWSMPSYEPSTEWQSAPEAGPLLVIPLQAEDLFEIENDFFDKRNNILVKKSTNFVLMYADMQVLCSTDPIRMKDNTYYTNKLRYCFIDRDNNGEFESFFEHNSYDVSPVIISGFIPKKLNSITPIRFSKIPSSQMRAKFDIKISVVVLGGTDYSIGFFLDYAGYLKFGARNYSVPVSEAPLKIPFYGGFVEYEKAVDGKFRYRTIGPFSGSDINFKVES